MVHDKSGAADFVHQQHVDEAAVACTFFSRWAVSLRFHAHFSGGDLLLGIIIKGHTKQHSRLDLKSNARKLT